MRFFRKRDSTVREKWKKNKEGMMSEKPRENKISKKEYHSKKKKPQRSHTSGLLGCLLFIEKMISMTLMMERM